MVRRLMSNQSPPPPPAPPVAPLETLRCKPDLPLTKRRFAAWWEGAVIDRPPVSLHVQVRPPTPPAPRPAGAPRSRREAWLDPEHALAWTEAALAARAFVGDEFPMAFANVGPDLTATVFGCELEFGEGTSWAQPVVHDEEGWRRLLERAPDFTNPYWAFIERAMDLFIERADGRWIVGLPDLHGNYDILVALRGPENVCLDTVECPELLREVGRHVRASFVAGFERLYRKVAAAGHPCTTWTTMLHGGPAYVPSSDFWCLVGEDYAREAVLPDIRFEMAPLERSIFHLDGPGALRHLGLLLEVPELDAVQWVYGAGNGPAAKWLDVYRRILAAGKSVQVLAETPEDALACARALPPEGVWMQVGQGFTARAEAEAFLRAIAKEFAAK